MMRKPLKVAGCYQEIHFADERTEHAYGKFMQAQRANHETVQQRIKGRVFSMKSALIINPPDNSGPRKPLRDW